MGIWNWSVEPREYNENVCWNLWDTCFPHSSLLPGARCIKRKQKCFMNSSFSFHVFWEDKQQFPKANGYCTRTVTVFKTYIYIYIYFCITEQLQMKIQNTYLTCRLLPENSTTMLYVHPFSPPNRKCELNPWIFRKFFSYSKYSTPIMGALEYMHSNTF